MSLLDVFVIFAFYDKAEKKGQKITNQRFDNEYVLSKIKEIEQYHSSALHWNLNELNANLHSIIDKVKSSYAEKVSLIEGKHTKNAVLPSKGDIKDGLLKMILYCNLAEVAVDGEPLKSEAVLSLTSSKLKGAIDNFSNDEAVSDFVTENNFSDAQKNFD